jgi:hypothetical protein
MKLNRTTYIPHHRNTLPFSYDVANLDINFFIVSVMRDKITTMIDLNQFAVKTTTPWPNDNACASSENRFIFLTGKIEAFVHGR